MFSIASQSVTNPKLGLTVNFTQLDADTSKCICEITTAGPLGPDDDGDATNDPHTIRLTFNRAGLLFSQQVVEPDGTRHDQTFDAPYIPEAAYRPDVVNTSPGANPFASTHQPITDRTRPRANEASQADIDTITDKRDAGGRDPTADDPYAYKAPVNSDSAQRGDVNVGFKQQPFDTDKQPIPDKPEPVKAKEDAPVDDTQWDNDAGAEKPYPEEWTEKPVYTAPVPPKTIEPARMTPK